MVLQCLKNVTRPIFVLSMFACLLTCAAWTQAGRGGISGLITDPSGAIVPGATILAKNTATGITRSTVSSAAGVYSFLSLVPGNYALTASETGFETVVQNNIAVSVDQTTAMNIALRLGGTMEVVTVTDTTSLIETTNSTVGQLISSATIDRVPMASRNVFELVQLSAGVSSVNGTPNGAETTGIFNQRSGADVSAYTFNGALQGTVYYMLDGSPMGIAESNIASIIPAFQVPQELVDEFRVETQNTPATYESAGAGVISMVSKSGGNQFHGSAFTYLRPDVLAANDYFLKKTQLAAGEANQPASFHRYQEGGSISGPILHSKLFFFADYEATQQASLETATYTVPTVAERTGDFSADNFTVYNPMVSDNANGARQAFNGNVISPGYLNSTALLYAKQFPKPNQVGTGDYHIDNYFASGLDPNKAQKFDIRTDYYLNDKQRIFGRFSFDRLFFGSAHLYGDSNTYDPLYYQNITNGRNIVIADDYALTSTSLLQLRYSFTRHYEDQTGDPRQVGFDMTTLGFPSSLASEQNYRQIPYMSFGNYTTAIGGAQPWATFLFASETSDVTATYSTVIGKHALSAGLEYQKRFLNEGQPIAPSGSYAFNNTATSSTSTAGDGSDFASFLLGMGEIPGNESENFTKDIFGAQSNPYYAAFVQDEYHILPNLTATLGVRWDIFGGRTERHNRLEYFDPDAIYTSNGVSLKGGEIFAGQGVSRSPFATKLKDFGPRIGLAWQPISKLAIHSGFGIYYGPSPSMVANSSFNSDGFFTQTAWTSTKYNSDGNTVMVNAFNNAFPNGVVQPTKGSLGLSTGIGGTLGTQLHSQRTPTTYNYNFGFEYQFPHSIVFSAGYVGSRGLFLPLSTVDLNQLSLGTIGEYGSSLTDEVANQWEAALPSTSAFYGSSTVPRWLTLQPFPQYSNGGINNGVVIHGYPGGDSEYNSLQMKIQKRLTSHFTTLASYTWSKLISDDAASPLDFIGNHGTATPQDWRNMRLERTVSPQDLSYQFNWQLSYDLPAGKGRALHLQGISEAILGEWTVNSILFRSSGTPINTPNGTLNPYFSQRVNMNCDPSKGAPHTAAQWFNYTCFSQPSSQYTAGTAPAFLSHVRTDGGHNLDLSMRKNLVLRKGTNLMLEVSSYNITNSVQLGYPNVFWNPSPTDSNMAGFGKITSSVNTPRQFQFASKFTF
jgi:hypothetical protein